MSIKKPTNKPSWEKAPLWARYLTKDTSGCWCWWENEPTYTCGSWCRNEGLMARADFTRGIFIETRH